MDLPFGSGDPDAFADAPLFRELQRVMSSSSGPVNWEMARQIGIANAQEGREDPAPTDEDRRMFEEVVRVAELHVARFTGLEQPTDVVETQARPPRRLGQRQHPEPARAAGARREEDRYGDGRGDPRGAGTGGPVGDAGDERDVRAALAAAAGRTGRVGARVPRATRPRAVRHRDPALGAGRHAVRRVEHRAVRARLVARSHRLPHVRRDPRGDASVRVRAPVGARTVRRAAPRLPLDAEDRRGRDAGAPGHARCRRIRRRCSR